MTKLDSRFKESRTHLRQLWNKLSKQMNPIFFIETFETYLDYLPVKTLKTDLFQMLEEKQKTQVMLSLPKLYSINSALEMTVKRILQCSMVAQTLERLFSLTCCSKFSHVSNISKLTEVTLTLTTKRELDMISRNIIHHLF